ncbi:glycine zipper 2TM domain-containing protein [Sphingoaurantiacus capsulatus]|uniref:17 kDa surface antigen n=1 Tax=Sphingoaurantiacus capsulatus TaxID=1771310 RepID=A0ABV7X6N0_9SPHN
MHKSLLALSALSMIGAVVAATPALAGDRDRVSYREIRRDVREVREERRDYQRALRSGDRREIREARRDLRGAERELRQDHRDLRRAQAYRGGGYYAPAYYGGGPQYAYRGDRRGPQGGGWYGRGGRYYGNDYDRCRKDSNADGTVLGAVAGGVLGNVIAQQGDKALGTAIGAGVGGVIGNRIDNGKGGRRCY